MNFSAPTLHEILSALSSIERVNSLWKKDKGTLLLEWAVIWLATYAVIRFLRGARGGRAVKVIATPLALGALFFVLAEGLDFNKVHLEQYKELFSRLSLLYTNFLMVLGLVMLVAFQPELRRSVVHLGEMRFLHFGRGPRQHIVDSVCGATEYLAKNRIGAIIALERHVSLAPFLESGTALDAALSKELLATLFWPGSMLHDLGVVIRGDRVVAAGVQFPLADADLLPQELGSRHRAALGLSNEVDALIIVVSEETGIVSIAYKGHLKRNLDAAGLRAALLRGLPNPTLLGLGRKQEEEPILPESGATPPAPAAATKANTRKEAR